MEYVFSPADPPSVEVSGTIKRFPVHRIFCVGRNYAEHAGEMGANPDLEQPFFFSKPPDAVVPEGSFLDYPAATQNLHHAVQLVVALAEGGSRIEREKAFEKIFGYAVGIDLTRRDLQSKAKKKGHPWDTWNGFDHSAPCGAIHSVSEIGHPRQGIISLEINGEPRQQGNLDQMIWGIPDMISILSGHFRLIPGDLIYTGTPAGVGPVLEGDMLQGRIEGIGSLEITFR